MTEREKTPAEQFRAFVEAELSDRRASRTDKVDAIVAEFAEWLTAHQAGTAVELVNGRVAVETVEWCGLQVGIDATGRATRVEAVNGELTWSTP